MSFIITELRIDGLHHMYGDHPESTPIGPFASREEAWAYAHALQARYGTGGGSCEVSVLNPPRRDLPERPPPHKPPWEQFGLREDEWDEFVEWIAEKRG